ncbi:MAG: WG repeat-containing protein [Cyanobacteria bacterium P01_H01_bin.153]
MDASGTTTIAPTFQNAGRFSESLARVQINQQWGFIKPDGTLLTKP